MKHLLVSVILAIMMGCSVSPNTNLSSNINLSNNTNSKQSTSNHLPGAWKIVVIDKTPLRIEEIERKKTNWGYLIFEEDNTFEGKVTIEKSDEKLSGTYDLDERVITFNRSSRKRGAFRMLNKYLVITILESDETLYLERAE